MKVWNTMEKILVTNASFATDGALATTSEFIAKSIVDSLDGKELKNKIV